MMRVTWQIDLDTETPEAAAREAFRIMRKPDTTATVFQVCDAAGGVSVVDLMEETDGEKHTDQPAERAAVRPGVCRKKPRP